MQLSSCAGLWYPHMFTIVLDSCSWAVYPPHGGGLRNSPHLVGSKYSPNVAGLRYSPHKAGIKYSPHVADSGTYLI